jgi:hypothetical protein
MIMVFGVDPENITLLATEEDADKIVRHVRVDNVIEGRRYYEEAPDDEREEWEKKPLGNVTERVLPLIKSSFLCYAKGNRK